MTLSTNDVSNDDFSETGDVNENKLTMATADRKKREKKNENIGEQLRNEIIKDMVEDTNEFIVVNVFKPGGARPKNIYPRHTTGFMFDPPRRTVLPDSKRLFLKCVLLMAFTMFLFSGILVLYFIFTPDVRNYLSNNVLTCTILPMLLFLIIDFAFLCVNFTRIGPCNFVCLCLTVLSLSTVAGAVSASIESLVLLFAIFATTFTMFVAVFLTCTKFDFKSYKLYIVMLGTAFGALVIIVSYLVMIGSNIIDALWMLILVIVTFVQVVLITMQLQSILWGTTIEVKDNDYALGAFMLYGSIFDIFIKAMQLATVTRNIEGRR